MTSVKIEREAGRAVTDREFIQTLFADCRFDFSAGHFRVFCPRVRNQSSKLTDLLTFRERIAFTLRLAKTEWKVIARCLEVSTSTARRDYDSANSKISRLLVDR